MVSRQAEEEAFQVMLTEGSSDSSDKYDRARRAVAKMLRAVGQLGKEKGFQVPTIIFPIPFGTSGWRDRP